VCHNAMAGVSARFSRGYALYPVTD
jgi:hypothetical protein